MRKLIPQVCHEGLHVDETVTGAHVGCELLRCTTTPLARLTLCTIKTNRTRA